MPKPNLDRILEVFDVASSIQGGAVAVAALIDAWEAEMKAESESPAVAWEHDTPEKAWERFNELQRARREGYAEALESIGYIYSGDIGERAARRYPLKKRVPKVIPDPYGAGDFGTELIEGEPVIRWRRGDKGLDWFNVPETVWLNATRVRALAALLDDPWTLEDDHSVEEP